MTKIIDKTAGLRPYKGGLYSFLVKHVTGREKMFTGSVKLKYKGFINKNVKQITIDLL
jgi:hypothetical protein